MKVICETIEVCLCKGRKKGLILIKGTFSKSTYEFFHIHPVCVCVCVCGFVICLKVFCFLHLINWSYFTIRYNFSSSPRASDYVSLPKATCAFTLRKDNRLKNEVFFKSPTKHWRYSKPANNLTLSYLP